MKKIKVVGILSLLIVIFASGCASIPQESVTLSKELAVGITSIHESNKRFVNQYFDNKKFEIEKYEKAAIDDFFEKIALATRNPEAPPLEVKDLYNIKEVVAKIHQTSNKFKSELDASNVLIIEKLQKEYNALISANSSITGILQSAVDMDKAKNDGLQQVKEFTDGKIDLTDIESKVDEYLSKLGTAAAQSSSLIESIESVLNP